MVGLVWQLRLCLSSFANIRPQDMVQFSGETDQNYRSVLGKLKTMVEEILAENKSSTEVSSTILDFYHLLALWLLK